MSSGIKALLIVLCMQIFSMLSLAARDTKIPLHEKNLLKLNEVLDQTSKFHEALFTKNNKLASVYIKELNREIELLIKSLSEFQVQNQDMHLKRILKSTHDFFDSYQNLPDTDDKLSNLKKAFAQLVQLVRIYNVDKKYVIYYCKDDNAEWIQDGQKSKDPKNPISPDKFGNCGVRAYR